MSTAPPATLYSLGSIVQWIDDAVTSALVGGVATTIERIIEVIWLPLELGVSLYLLFYGYLIATQQIPTPFGAALWRIVKIIIIVGIISRGGLYQTAIAEAMIALPDGLMRAVTGQTSSAQDMLADFHNSGLETATRLEERAPSMLAQIGRSILFSIVSLAITVLYTIVTVLGLILNMVAKVGIAIVAMLGPIFIAFLLFESSKKYFMNWLNQALYFSLYGLLFTMTFVLVMNMLGYVQSILLRMTEADSVNIFQVFSVVLVIAVTSMFIFKLPSTILRAVTTGQSIDIPLIGRI